VKHTASYSHAHGALLIFGLLCLGVCFFDGTWLSNVYSAYVQPYTTSVNKTHLIVGAPHQPQPANAGGSAQVPQSSYSRVLFSPDDDIAHELVTLINNEKTSIRVAIFTFTDSEIAQALVDASNRGVKVEVVADTAYLRDQYSKIPLLQQHNIPVFTYNPHYKNARQKKKEFLSIMHHKLMIFEQNKDNQSVVVSGSYNFTRAARRNQEYVTISNDQGIITRFGGQFERLKKRCDNCFEQEPVIKNSVQGAIA
jgi:phosphatidylserine/phosphatidylglycerophosphate/cardiolipin synthase-like enzyme